MRNKYKILGFLIALVVLNVLGNYLYYRWDLTQEKRYTLSALTREMLQKQTKPIEITVFLEGDLPPAFKRMRQGLKDLLEEYKTYSGASFKLSFVDPLAGLTGIDRDTTLNNLYQNGIEPLNLNIKTDDGFSQKMVFPIAAVASEGRYFPLRLIQNLDAGSNYEENINKSLQNLEYLFSSAIHKLMEPEVLRIGFTESNGELSDAALYDAIHSLSQFYEVGRVDLKTISKAGLDRLKLMIIAKPQEAFSEMEKYKINYFVMQGGSLVWSIDQVSAELEQLKNKNTQTVLNRSLNLDDQLFMYGARINYNIIGDLNCASIPITTGQVAGQNQIQLAPWIYYPILSADTTQDVVKHLDGVRSEFPSTVDSIAVKGIQKHFLLYSSDYAQSYQSPKALSLQMVQEMPDPQSFRGKALPVALLLEGSFPSVFYGRPLPAGIESPFSQEARGKSAKMMVFGDGDLFKNQLNTAEGLPFPLGYDRYSQTTFGNKSLLLNIADYMTSTENFIALRAKELKVPLLDRAKLRTDKLTYQVINIIAPLLMLILFAIFQHYYRKHKYAG